MRPHLVGFFCNFIHLFFHFVEGVIDGAVVLQEVRSHNSVVDGDGAVELGGDHQPHHQNALDKPVQGEPAHDEIGEVLDDGEQGEHHPIGQPFGVVVLLATLDGVDGHVGWVEEAHRVTDQLGCIPEDQP